MIDISNITINRCDNQIIPDISLCGKLEAFVGGYFLSNVFKLWSNDLLLFYYFNCYC